MNQDVKLREKIENIAIPFIEEMGLDFVDLSIRHHKRDIYIEILADRKEGGITVDECSQINKRIGNSIEEKSLIQGRYMLEVSSPGLDRPLKRRQDFERTLGRNVRFFLDEPVDEKKEYAGIIQEVNQENITIEDNGKSIKLPINAIRLGKQIIE